MTVVVCKCVCVCVCVSFFGGDRACKFENIEGGAAAHKEMDHQIKTYATRIIDSDL